MSSRTHYVLVVHGTGAKPAAGERPWFGAYEEPGNFCWELEERLRGSELDGAVFRARPADEPYWCWSGKNSHFDRIDAAEALAEEIGRIAGADPGAVIHIVAHSHGGNVLLKAVERLAGAGADEAAPPLGRLGKLVFLGTPFFRRRWKRRFAWGETFVNLAAIAVSMGIMFGAITYGAIAVVRLAMWALGDLGALDAVLPSRWGPGLLTGWALAVVAIEVVMFALMRGALATRRVDSNVYFSDLVDRPDAPLPALVVHSGRLDEALLGLTAKPLLDTALNPVVSDVVDNAMGRTRINPRWIEPVAGDRARFTHALRSFLHSLVFLLKAGTNRAFAWVLDPLNRALKRRLRTTVLSVAELAALGLPASEGRGSIITVSERPELPGLLDLQVRDVARDLLRSTDDHGRKAPATNGEKTSAKDDSHTEVGPERIRDFEFLWDEETLAELARESEAWSRIGADLDRLLREYPPQDPERFTLNLKRSALTLERRWKEVTGAVSLEHSGYYQDPVVIDAIAAFLTGDTPERQP